MSEPVLSDLAIGTAAEHLVCCDLFLKGYTAFRTDQACPYDVVALVGDRMIRIQVKATLHARSIPQRVGHHPAYMWHVRRAGKGGRRVYADGEFDLLALVALDSRRIAYLPPSKVKQTIHIRTHEDEGPRGPNGGGRRGKLFAHFSFDNALAEVG